ncbi:OsmC family protein [Flavobacterium algicola]|uniref:OsmC family protein n=1 Tax=Flavobacterium algicola TaxID=556529 RepID=UPI001EFC590C|nr:OsmC family protein [Flavobacterium algicola]MCG9791028.1 OsmC family protein [Flavobacterium algicola]
MNYQNIAASTFNDDTVIQIKQSNIAFGTTSKNNGTLPNPAELFLGSFASCILKNVERFSELMKFTYTEATTEVNAVRLENPPRMDNIEYKVVIHSSDGNLNTTLLKKNIEKHGTIYNTVKAVCTITGTISIVDV